MTFNLELERPLNPFDACLMKFDVSQQTSLDMHSSAVYKITIFKHLEKRVFELCCQEEVVFEV